MKIRKMERADKPILLRMMTDFYSSSAILHRASAQILEKDIDDCISDLPFAEGFVCDCGAVAGYTIVSKGYSTEYGGVCIMIEDLYVHPDYRGQGMGEALLRFVEERYKAEAVRLRLEVEPSNAGALRLYAKCGYKPLAYKQMTKEL